MWIPQHLLIRVQSHLDSMLRTRVPARVVYETQYGVSLPKVNGLGQYEVRCADSRLAQVVRETIFEAGFGVSRIVELPKGKEIAVPEIVNLALNFS